MMHTNNHCSDDTALNTGRTITDAIESPVFLGKRREQPSRDLTRLICKDYLQQHTFERAPVCRLK
jgi:hypothetical protein